MASYQVQPNVAVRLLLLTMAGYAVYCASSGTREASFLVPFRNAVDTAIVSGDDVAICLQDFTDFEWDEVQIVYGGSGGFSLSVNSGGVPWIALWFVGTPHDGYALWVFKKNGFVTYYTQALYRYQYDPGEETRLGVPLPRIAQNFNALGRDEAVFKVVELSDSTRDWRRTVLFPIASKHPKNSWRGFFQDCVKEKSIYDTCAQAAFDKYPYKSTRTWPR